MVIINVINYKVGLSMTLINKILRVIPKKRVDIEDLDRKNIIARVEPIQTIKRESVKTGNSSEYNTQEDDMVDGEYEIIEREIMPEKIICPDCGGITLEGLEFCDKCGGDLTNF